MNSPMTVLPPPRAIKYFLKGRSFAKQGRWSESVREYRKALQIAPEFADAHNRLGLMLLRHGHLEAAAEEFQSILDAKPSNSQAHNNLGLVRKHQGCIEDSVAQFQEAIAADPRNPKPRTVRPPSPLPHRAQLGVYYRLLDIPVPSVYGPTADEAM